MLNSASRLHLFYIVEYATVQNYVSRVFGQMLWLTQSANLFRNFIYIYPVCNIALDETYIVG